MTLGDRIRQARERVGLSQIELARRIGLSKNAMNSIETGDADPRASRIVAIAQELGVSTDALLLDKQATGSREHKPAAKRQRPRHAAPVAS
jgi:transcriptional regulator with XRE-family HTH domain